MEVCYDPRPRDLLHLSHSAMHRARNATRTDHAGLVGRHRRHLPNQQDRAIVPATASGGRCFLSTLNPTITIRLWDIFPQHTLGRSAQSGFKKSYFVF